MKKYSNADAFKMLEKFIASCESHPRWFQNLTLDDDRVRSLFDSGYIVPLAERDKNGCRVIMIRAGQLDAKKFTFSDELKLINLVLFTLLEEAETQIAGFVFVIDHKGIAFDYVATISLVDLRNYLKCIQNAIPSRQKQAIWLNLPAFAVAMTEIGKTLVSAKLRDRALFYKDFDSVFKHVDKKLLPKEYGGQVTIKEMMESFENIYNSKREKLLEIEQQTIDLTQVKGRDTGEAIDSFRKLEID